MQVEEEAHVLLKTKATGNDEFRIEQFDFMPMGTTLDGNRIVDPNFPPLLEGPLGIPTLPSLTPPREMEEGEIPLLPIGEP